ncbi:hypothetical protein MXAN_0843 [Myxococcus xanthus DK 1622]|uniref:Uncharacterized protein n=1 Tax=Myxococcus xanthus (strain DK1622) TaxID=246197 RepID=Q1DE18_MYXXD|nr:hypothetical protein MXAN_0843 [Myxococcus xanthus DK 1622]
MDTASAARTAMVCFMGWFSLGESYWLQQMA